jgi:hypothetical protein
MVAKRQASLDAVRCALTIGGRLGIAYPQHGSVESSVVIEALILDFGLVP